MDQAFSLEPVELRLETVRECDLGSAAQSIRKKRKKNASALLTKSGKKAGARGTTERGADNLLTNYLVKQETERAAPGSALLAKAAAKRPSLVDKSLIS